MSAVPARDASVGGCLQATVERRADGSTVLRSTEPLGWYPARLTDHLEQWAGEVPDRTFVARRDAAGRWQSITYAQMLEHAQAVGQSLIDLGLSVERPLAILSDNSLEHLTLAMGALWAGVPFVPVSPAYSLLSNDHAKLKHIIGGVTPGLVFATDPSYGRAIAAVVPSTTPVVLSRGELPGRAVRRYDELLRATPGASLAAAHAQVGPDTIAKFLFTSGSTKAPKGVINTHRMWCANQQMLRQCMRFLSEEPPVLVDWLPWNHTFGGNHNIGITLANGGTLYIDAGRPVAGAMETTVSNLREIATTAYFNVPKGFDMLLPILRGDAEFRAHFFSRLQLLFYAAAGLRSEVADGLQNLAIATVGRAIPWVTGLGSTETAPAAMFTGPLLSTAAHIGAPIPGVHLKAAPVDGRLEARVKGPNITPGYWRNETLTRAAFDDEGYYRMGDAIAPIDPSNLTLGFVFQGRLDEDFKLSTGTWVRVGALRARLLAAIGDLVQDVVITGHGRDDVGALLFPNIAACRALAGMATDAAVLDVLASASVREGMRARLDAFNAANSGSSTSIQRARVLEAPPSLEMKEITDKGSLNQRAVLAHRAAVVDDLYASTAPVVLC